MAALRRHFGTAWLARRAVYSLKLRSGAIRRALPARAWGDLHDEEMFKRALACDAASLYERRLANSPRFFFSPADRQAYAPFLRRFDGDQCESVRSANEIAAGKFTFFQHRQVDCGFPPDWHLNAVTGSRTPADAHWSEIDDFGAGDIKVIWELSRFSSAYALVRAYWRTGDELYPEVFWQLVEDWRKRNAPQQGANWKCGQEASFRAMAWCFGLYGFLQSPATTPVRVRNLVQMLGATAMRIAANIDYAIAQANNHGISEGVGLWTIGRLFPELSGAEEWQQLGRTVLESEGRKLIYDDGAFAQHSVNYHRLMLHDYIWALELGELHQQAFTAELKERVARAGEFLFQIQDEATGKVPYYGQNDGALILPLNNCGYHDFRPVIGAGVYFASRTRRFDAGPWDEDLFWFFGSQAMEAPVKAKSRHDLCAEQGGYYTLRSDDGFVFTRCGSFRHRPSQADMLHVDLWWRGQNIALDAGTYSYNSTEPSASAFAGTAVHNTTTVDGRDQMEQAGRFLWLPWVRGRVRCFERTGEIGYFEGEHNGYSSHVHSPVSYRRALVQLGSGTWLVLDSLHGIAEHAYRMQWLLVDFAHEFSRTSGALSLATPVGQYDIRVGSVKEGATCSLVRTDPNGARGWLAPFYGYRQPALSLTAEQRAQSIVFWTLFSPDPGRVVVNEKCMQVERTSGTTTIAFATDATMPLVRKIQTPKNELALA